MKIILEKEVDREIDIIEVGYGICWKCLFLSFLVPIYRYDYLIGFLVLLLNIVAILLGIRSGGIEGVAIGIGLYSVVNIVLSFIYNEIFIEKKVKEGYIIKYSEENLEEENN